MKTTWRFQFIDINKSITINQEEERWAGFAVVRAPKGSTKAMYIPPRNPDMIKSMFGYPSADWPDIFEILDFNNQYGLYVSAPTIDVAEYPNYYGGVYFTKQGVVPLYKITNKKKPTFEVGLLPGKEKINLPGVVNSKITLANLNVPVSVYSNPQEAIQAKIEIKGIDSKVYQKLKYLDINWKKLGTFRYKLDKTNNYLLPDDSCVTDTIGKSKVCGSFGLNSVTGKYEIIIGGQASDHSVYAKGINALNTPEDEEKYKIPFLDFGGRSYKSQTAYDYGNLMKSANVNTIDAWKAFLEDKTEIKNLPDDILDAIINGGKILLPDGTKLVYDKPLLDMFRLVYDIEDDVYAYLIQPSATAQKTSITIDSVIYDKYVYSKKMLYTSEAELPQPTKAPEKFAKLLTSDGSYALKVEKNLDETLKSVKVFRYEYFEDDEDNPIIPGGDLGKWVDATSDLETEAILAFDTIDAKKENLVHHKIFRVTSTGLNIMTVDNEDEDLRLQEHKLYNSFHAKSVEEDMEGEKHTSGDFRGSLDQFGTDENGGDNYWEELIPPDDAITFAEVYVVRTFDKDLDDEGIYTGFRVDSNTTTVSGQRYVDYVVQRNIKEGKTGGDCTTNSINQQKKFAKIVRAGLQEAAKPKYGDCSLFMEFSGLDLVKPYLTAIRVMHYTATIITAKNINQQLFENIGKLTVVNRLRGSAQYVQELLYKDKNIKKKYYACPLGAMGAMLMKIMEGYLGGVAPAWINEGEVGGQLEEYMLRSPVGSRWDFEDLDTKILDQKGVNPIAMDVDDGVMALSHKTTELNAGDWSFLGHSMAFDLCKREIRDNVMKPQLVKKINPFYINKRQGQVDRILAKRTSGDNPIWSYVHCDINSANNDYTRAQNMFLIPVEVRVFPYSEKVKLSFTNLSQQTVVSD